MTQMRELSVVYVPLPCIPLLLHSPTTYGRATCVTNRHDDGSTVSRGRWGNVVRMRCTEVVHILEERERERGRGRGRERGRGEEERERFSHSFCSLFFSVVPFPPDSFYLSQLYK